MNFFKKIDRFILNITFVDMLFICFYFYFCFFVVVCLRAMGILGFDLLCVILLFCEQFYFSKLLVRRLSVVKHKAEEKEKGE